MMTTMMLNDDSRTTTTANLSAIIIAVPLTAVQSLARSFPFFLLLVQHLGARVASSSSICECHAKWEENRAAHRHTPAKSEPLNEMLVYLAIIRARNQIDLVCLRTDEERSAAD